VVARREVRSLRKHAGAVTRISDRLKGLSLRQRFLVAPVLGLLLLGLLIAAFIYKEHRQEALLARIANRDLAAFDHYFGVFINLSAQHIALYELLSIAGEIDEATLYDSAKVRLYAVHEAVRNLQQLLPAAAEYDRGGNAGAEPLRSEILQLALAYRESAVTAVEMTTVNRALAPAYMARVNNRFIAMNRAFARLLELQQKALASEIVERIGNGKQATTAFASIGIGLAALLLALSIALSRILSRSLEAQIGILAQLGERTWADTKTQGASEVERIEQAISAFRRTQVDLRESEEHYRQLVELSPDAIVIESKGRIGFVNSACVNLFRADNADELVGMRTVELIHPDCLDAAREHRSRIGASHDATSLFDTKIIRLDGTTVEVEASAGPFLYRGKPGTQVVMRDITERKQAAERLAYLAQYDSLTALPNRSLFRDRLSLAMARAERNGQMTALMFLDLDRFKDINDTLGHPAGDKVLQAAAGLLVTALRHVDTVARLGGDEFTIILEDIVAIEQVTAIAEKIRSAFSDAIVVEGHDIFVTASIGITLYPLDADNIDALLQAADVAMYHAKEQGRNTYEFYAPELNAEAAGRLHMAGLLRRALERNELVLHYQPKVELKSGRISGVEALVRWHSAELGPVSPAQFIPMAENSGLIIAIGEWVLETACAQNKAWQDQGIDPLLISVNLSPRQFRQKNLVQMIARVLADIGLAPHHLDLEITEGMIMQDADEAIALLNQIRGLGVRLSIDDFGTAYSSLGYLKRFPIDSLKIDRSFVTGLPGNQDDASIAQAVITMAHALRLKVVAEGVEDEAQLEFLAASGCDEMQGYYFSRPLPADLCTRMLLDHDASQSFRKDGRGGLRTLARVA
jgi:diguanylate cyclase (GGDEF)-like protein/PAS domain S-box-containing protein